MKIAVCISGQPRAFRWAAKSLLSSVKTGVEKVDFYIHMWDTNNSYTVSKYVRQYEDPLTLSKDICRIYAPERYLVESQKNVKEFFKEKEIETAGGEEFQSYSFWRSIQLLQPNLERYDLVIWTRPDTLFGKWDNGSFGLFKFNWNYIQSYTQNISEPYLWSSSVGRGFAQRTFCNDYLLIGTPTAFNVIAECFEDYFIDRATCRVKFQDRLNFRYDMGAFHTEGIVPMFAEHYRIGLVQDYSFIDGDFTVLRQCVVEAGIDPYSEKGCAFFFTYHKLYLCPVPLTVIKKMYEAFLDNIVLPIFQDEEEDCKFFGNEYRKLDSLFLEKRILEELKKANRLH